MNFRNDLTAIAELVPQGVRVLDLGCGQGELLETLVQIKKVEARGVELSEVNVRACVARGLSVRQGNIEEGLEDYPNQAFDFVILSQTLPYLDAPGRVLTEMLRVGRQAIVSFQNDGHWKQRLRILFGRRRVNSLISGEPRARAMTWSQFCEFVNVFDAQIQKQILMSGGSTVFGFEELLTETVVAVLQKTPSKCN